MIALAAAAIITAAHPVAVGNERVSAKEIRHWERIAEHNKDMNPRSLREQALLFVIDNAKLRAEAKRRKVTVTEEEVTARFEEQKAAGYGSEADFQAFLESSGQTVEDLRLRVRTQLLSEKLRPLVRDDYHEYWQRRTRCGRRYFTKLRCRPRR